MVGIGRRALRRSREARQRWEARRGSARRARRRERVREFGRRHPRLALIIGYAAPAGIVAVCAAQLSYGAYLGRGWVIAALAGMATVAMLSAAVLISWRRHSLAGRSEMAWLVLWLMSVSAIRYPFPPGSFGSVQAFFNVVHAALLGYAPDRGVIPARLRAPARNQRPGEPGAWSPRTAR